MRHVFKFPDIGEGLDEGTIVEWYVEKGQTVASGESLVKMETDKVVTDIPSPRDGVIAARYGNEGETINVGDPLVELEIEGVEGEEAQEESKKIDEGDPGKQETVEEEEAGVVGTLESAGNNAFLPSSDEGDETDEKEEKKKHQKALATPVARALAKELNVDINKVNGTGPGNRVMKEDIQKYADSSSYSDQAASSAVSTEEQKERVEVENMSQLRKTIAKNMLRSKHNAAHMSVFDEVEVSELINIREKHKNRFQDDGIKLSFLPFILKATAKALQKHRSLNAEMDMDNGKMIFKNYYNIGIAVDTDEGLLVPVIKDVDKLSIKQIAEKVAEIAEKSRNREIKMEDMKDGTFTITSFGSIGGKFAVPVINYPQAGILGIGKISKEPVVKGDAVVAGNKMPLSLSVDHRIVDGGEVSRFLNTMIDYLADPVSLIMD